jgi:hypothetical protein
MASKDDNREIGSLVHFEHVNFRVPDHYFGTLFFIEGLGFTREPTRRVGVSNMWVNVGQQQFHLPIGEAAPFAGEVGITLPDLDATYRKLKSLAPKMEGTKFKVAKENSTLRIVTPWGHVLIAHAARELSGRLLQAIPYVTFFVPAGTAAGIGRFYEQLLGAPVTMSGRGSKKTASVTVGVNQTFHFVDTTGVEIPEHPNHVAIYVSRYRSIYRDMRKSKLIMAPDNAEQFRFADMADPNTGKTLFSFEHEVRSLHHPDFLQPLANRVPVPYLVD